MTRSLDPSLQHLRQLGGFRRQFVQKRAQARGEEVPRMLRSFVDFLFLYGHFVSRTALTTASAA
jgi:proton-coupled amino acid transporter